MSLRDAIMPFVPGLRRYARALVNDPLDNTRTADDLVQKTLARAVKDERLKRGGNIRTLLYATLTALNRSRLRQEEVAKAEYAAGASSSSRGASFPETAGHSRIERALAALPADLREVALLVSLERMSYDEVAEIIEVPLVTMLARLTRARDELRIHFNGTVTRQAQQGAAARTASHLRLVK